jgi:Ca2+-binding EF-hand superfamily protein
MIGKGQFNFYQFLDTLRELNIHCDERDAYLLFVQLNCDDNKYLDFSEFIPAIEPFAVQYAECMKDRKPIFINNHLDFSLETNRLFKQLLAH